MCWVTKRRVSSSEKFAPNFEFLILIECLVTRSLIFSKKFFWFSDEPVEHKHLSGYVSNEKSDVAHPNAAHAAQTGKGLLFFAKRAEDRPQPAGILNLVRTHPKLKMSWVITDRNLPY